MKNSLLNFISLIDDDYQRLLKTEVTEKKPWWRFW